ncbi:hypothetical protein [Desulfosarcina sp.]|uniref:hypothetical protein n=1 Tax=Desulfosarcina sp. TaxID=2027861 RepID=UPI0039709881
MFRKITGKGERAVIPEPNRRQYPRLTAYIIGAYAVLEGTFRDVIKNIDTGR